MLNIRLPLAALIATLALVPAVGQETPSEGPSLTVYPSFHVKFSSGGKNYLVGSYVLVNVSGGEIRNVTLRQTFPDALIPSPASAATHEYVARPEGLEESVDGATYTLRTPLLRRREMTTGFVTLAYRGRPSQASIPAAEVTYAIGGQERRESGPPLTLELTKYSKYSGSLADFLKRYAGLQIRIPESSAGDWGFSAMAQRVRAKTPIGMVEIDGDASEGRFSLLAGAPGDAREMLVSWRPSARGRPAATEADVRKLLHDQIFASADFVFEVDAAPVEKVAFGRGEAWTLATQWKDRVAARLGEGPLRGYVYTDPERGTQYVILLRAQGRGVGPGLADRPNPEKEDSLMKELDGIARSLRPI